MKSVGHNVKSVGPQKEGVPKTGIPLQTHLVSFSIE